MLVYCGRDEDPYQSVMEWWNTNGNKFTAPSGHLFRLLGIDPAGTHGLAGGQHDLAAGGTQKFSVGRGTVYVVRQDPKEFVLQAGGDSSYFRLLKQAHASSAHAGPLVIKNSFYLERGPYDIISVLDENADSRPYIVKGPVIDLFDPQLPVLEQKTIRPGSQSLLYDLRRMKGGMQPKVLASASRIYSERMEGRSYSFVAKSPLNTLNSLRVRLPAKPVAIMVTDSKGQAVDELQSSWDEPSHTEYLGFSNSPDGISVRLKW